MLGIAGAGVAAVYLLVCAGIFWRMRQPPDRIGPFMARLPGVAWAVLPLPTLWRWANRGELEPGDAAPDFELPTVDGGSRVRLSSLRGRPVVLVFGSYTCPPFRRRMPDMNRLYEPYKDRAAFLFIYIEEAHATDSWPARANAQEGVLYARARRAEDRVKAGAACASGLGIRFPMLADGLDERVGRAYRAWPIRVYVIDPAGKVAFKTEPGPFGFDAEPVRSALNRLL